MKHELFQKKKQKKKNSGALFVTIEKNCLLQIVLVEEYSVECGGPCLRVADLVRTTSFHTRLTPRHEVNNRGSAAVSPRHSRESKTPHAKDFYVLFRCPVLYCIRITFTEVKYK